jgi:hypothetical protein
MKRKNIESVFFPALSNRRAHGRKTAMNYRSKGKMRFAMTKTKIPRMSAPRLRKGPPPMKKLLPKWQCVKAIVEGKEANHDNG